jgi:hypothetical protein
MHRRNVYIYFIFFHFLYSDILFSLYFGFACISGFGFGGLNWVVVFWGRFGCLMETFYVFWVFFFGTRGVRSAPLIGETNPH